jgi:hypothetical protein
MLKIYYRSIRKNGVDHGATQPGSYATHRNERVLRKTKRRTLPKFGFKLFRAACPILAGISLSANESLSYS